MQNTDQAIEQAKNFYQSVNWQGVIDRLAEGLGTTGEYLWTVLVTGTVMEGWAGLIQSGLFMLVFGALGVWGIKQLRSQDYDKRCWNDADMGRLIFTGVFPTLAFLICTILVIANMKGDIMKVGAPEFKAIEFLISQGKS